MSKAISPTTYWRISYQNWGLFALLLLLAVALCYEAVNQIVQAWLTTEEYSHASFIPVITLFLIWQQKNELATLPLAGSWIGALLALAGALLYFVGDLASLVIIGEYAFLVLLFGLVLAMAGGRVFKDIWIPLFMLFFTIPLPEFLFQTLSSKLKLWSSVLGVEIIRLFDISVYLEGNVIDLGSYQLQVADACSGLNYLFPLVSIAFICAYFFQAPVWKKAIVFLSSIPITVAMNSFRIGMIGVLTEHFGKSMAEGFLHDFEGWFIFMACTGLLVGEMWMLAKIGKEPRPLMEVFGLVMPEPWPANAAFKPQRLPAQYWPVFAMLVIALGVSKTLEKRTEIAMARTGFDEFPMQMGDWHGNRQKIDQIFLKELKLTDYIVADFSRPGDQSSVNFYSAYYASQRKGASVHSPRSCLPSGGWVMASLDAVTLEGLANHGEPLKVNRTLIEKGHDRQLVYYWFQQRGRDITNEYVVKWFLLWDALSKNRTDGALVRLTTPVSRLEDVASADKRLRDFMQAMQPQLDRYVPD